MDEPTRLDDAYDVAVSIAREHGSAVRAAQRLELRMSPEHVQALTARLSGLPPGQRLAEVAALSLLAGQALATPDLIGRLARPT
jgi:hypothetical protein